MILVLVGSSVYGVAQSGAWFTDEEVLGSNTFETGIVDITAEMEVETPMNLKDMKPSQVDYLDFVVYNKDNSNPINLFKVLSDPDNSELGTSEPECLAEGGTWTEGATPPCDGNTQTANLGSQIRYDMRVELYDQDPSSLTSDDAIWWETIYMDEDDVTLSELWDQRMYLGMVPSGWYMKVMQSYHMPDTVGNEYQSDAIAFSMRVEAEQLGKSDLVLENKYEAGGSTSHHVWDGISATLGYTVRDRAFDYTLTTEGISGDYTLVAWPDPDNLWTWADRTSEAVVLAHVSSPVTDIPGSIDLNKSLINAKVWLVPGTFGTIGGAATGFPEWSGTMPTETLFETGLMDYYDADIY